MGDVELHNTMAAVAEKKIALRSSTSANTTKPITLNSVNTSMTDRRSSRASATRPASGAMAMRSNVASASRSPIVAAGIPRAAKDAEKNGK